MDFDDGALHLEKLRFAWAFAEAQTEVHTARYLQLFTACVGGAVATVAGILFERLPAEAGLLLLGALTAGALYAQARLYMLVRDLRRTLHVLLAEIDRLKKGGGR